MTRKLKIFIWNCFYFLGWQRRQRYSSKFILYLYLYTILGGLATWSLINEKSVRGCLRKWAEMLVVWSMSFGIICFLGENVEILRWHYPCLTPFKNFTGDYLLNILYWEQFWYLNICHKILATNADSPMWNCGCKFEMTLILYLPISKHICLFSEEGLEYMLIFGYMLIFEQGLMSAYFQYSLIIAYEWIYSRNTMS